MLMKVALIKNSDAIGWSVGWPKMMKLLLMMVCGFDCDDGNAGISDIGDGAAADGSIEHDGFWWW